MVECKHEFLVLTKDFKKRLYLVHDILICGACRVPMRVDWTPAEEKVTHASTYP